MSIANLQSELSSNERIWNWMSHLDNNNNNNDNTDINNDDNVNDDDVNDTEH